MRYPKYLINAFAILGVASFIFLACSASETAMDNEDPIENGGDNDGNNDGDNNPPIQNNNGKYQVSALGTSRFVVLNTENGVLKTYFYDGDGELNEGFANASPFSGNLTVTH
tara:strand:- start:206 stop:541 length:336 start_codon:yes stop_codon:yes gene_type:complete